MPEEAFARDREEYGPQVPLPADAGQPVPQSLATAREISRMRETRRIIDVQVRLAQVRLLEEERPGWNVSKAIEAAEWAEKSRGALRQIAEDIDDLLSEGSVSVHTLRLCLRSTADKINTLGP